MSAPQGPEVGAYVAAGVDYAMLDASKRLAMTHAQATSITLGGHGGQALEASRGEPAFVFQYGGQTLAFVLEGLGTKSIIAREVADNLGIDRFGDVAYDAVAAIVNDLCCVGAQPLVANAYFATGSSDWYRKVDRVASLMKGWQRACDDAGCTWGGGESPTLPDLLEPKEIELAGSAVGAVPAGVQPILGQDLTAGDEIVILSSTGIHANGASLARMVADRLKAKYATKLPSGATLGEALLEPSAMYSRFVAKALADGTPIHYISHITGHGLLKLMRPQHEFSYRLTALPEVPEVLEFLVAEAAMSSHAAYSTFNMGCGYAIYCASGAGAAVVALAEDCGHEARICGVVEAGPRSVIVEPIDVIYGTTEMDLSAKAPNGTHRGNGSIKTFD